jgi:ribosomal protein L12E/L44/L45/RPP1/RPP2
MPRKTKNVRRGRKNGGNRKQQRKTMRRKNVGGFNLLKGAQTLAGKVSVSAKSLAKQGSQNALQSLAKHQGLQEALTLAQDKYNQGTERAQSLINQGKNMVSDKQTQMAISEINKKQGDERVNVLNQILNDKDINEFLVAKPELKTEIIRNGLNEFLNANPDAKNEIITVENIEQSLLDQQNFRLKFINKFHNYKVNEVNGRLEERKSSLCKRDRIPVS